MSTKNLLIFNRFFGEFLPILPILGVFFSENGLNLSDLTVVFLTLAVTVAVCEVPASLFADRSNLKLVLLFSRCLKAVAFCIAFLVPTFSGFIVAAIFWGLSSAFDSGTFQAYLYTYLENVKKQDLFSKWYGYSMSAGMFGTLLATLATTQVVRVGFINLQYIGIIALFVSIGTAILLPNVIRRTTDSVNTNSVNEISFGTLLKVIMNHRSLFSIFAIGITAGAIKGTLDDYTSLLLSETGWSLLFVGYALLVIEIFRAFGTGFGGYFKLSTIKQNIVLLLIGMLFFIVGYFIHPLASLIGIVFIILLDSLLWVQNDTAIQEIANDDNRATYASIKNLGTEVISFALLGIIWRMGDSINIATVYVGAGLFILSVSVVLFFVNTVSVPRSHI